MVAEPLADMGPVFLFDMGIVVFVIGTGAGELNRIVWALGEIAL